MPRIARIVIPDVPYHVTQRGNNRQDVFFTDDDRRLYLDVLREQAAQFALDVLGWCLMTNHVHLVAIPRRADSLAKAVGRADWLYTRGINRLHGRSGHLWQNRFYSCALDEPHVVTAIRYIEQNPVRAKMCRVPWRYPWSSATAHVTGEDASGLLVMEAWLHDRPPREWRTMLTEGLEESEVKTLRQFTQRGRPLGTDSFLSRMESLLGRRVRPLPVGRPKGVGRRK